MKYQGKITDPKDLVTKEYVDTGLSGKQNTLTFDSTPTAGSSNPVTSDGIKSALDAQVVANPTFAGTEADLTALQVGVTKYKVPSGGGINLVVTVTNGTATSVTATKGGNTIALTYNSGAWTGMLSETGTWTVTITDGTHTNTATVNASTMGIYYATIYMPDVPSAYTQVEYIQSDGNQYIDTGLYGDLNTRVFISVQRESGTRAFGSRVGVGDAGCLLSTSSGDNIYFDFDSTYANRNSSGLPAWGATKHEIFFDKNGVTINGVSYDYIHASSTTAFTTPGTLLIFNGRSTDSQTTGVGIVGKIWAVKIWEAGILVFNGFPAKRNSDSAVGMYDTVTNTFFTNAGTGSLVAGPAV